MTYTSRQIESVSDQLADILEDNYSTADARVQDAVALVRHWLDDIAPREKCGGVGTYTIYRDRHGSREPHVYTGRCSEPAGHPPGEHYAAAFRLNDVTREVTA